MNTIRVEVSAYILGLFPQAAGISMASGSGGQRLASLANGLAVPSFWTRSQITDAFTVANDIWAQASIEFAPVTISQRTETVPPDENGMWIHFVNHLRPRRGIGVGFVFDLPANEGGWGGGHVAAISGWKTTGALQGFAGRLLAHELGHVLFNSPSHSSTPSNLMFGQRHRRVMTADQLDAAQITTARARAQTL